ncbi:2-oxoacid:acceptor oxidoreductase family protein [bacterium]|nr:2-oxoacid:acceptor oxidoreductase family protein [bacterium]
MQRILTAGFGGQGIVSMGKMLAYAGMKEDKHVSALPSYGPEMRGGTANCSVIISEKEIASPFISHPDTLIAMNQASLDKFSELVLSDGLIIANSSLVKVNSDIRNKIKVVEISADHIAVEFGNLKVANMVALGVFVRETAEIKLDSLKTALEKIFPPRRHNLIPINIKALEKGFKR